MQRSGASAPSCGETNSRSTFTRRPSQWKAGRSVRPTTRPFEAPRFNDSKWKTIKAGDSMAPVDRFLWMRNRVTIPKELAGKRGTLPYRHRQAGGALRPYRRALRRRPGGRGARPDAQGPATHEQGKGRRDVFDGGAVLHGAGRLVRDTRVRRRAAVPVGGAVFNGASSTRVNPDGFRVYHDFHSACDILEAMKEGSHQEAERRRGDQRRHRRHRPQGGREGAQRLFPRRKRHPQGARLPRREGRRGGQGLRASRRATSTWPGCGRARETQY